MQCGRVMRTAESLRIRMREGPPLLLDGATGTEIARRGIDVDCPEWSCGALLTAPEVVRDVHAAYVAARAEVLTANTFRTHARSLRTAGLADRAAELTRVAVELARDAAGDAAWVAGSQATLEDCYSPELTPPDAELEREHGQMSANLALADVDAILVETQNTIREARIAARSAIGTGLPVLVSFVCGRDGRLLSGEFLREAARELGSLGPDALLVNCLPADAVSRALMELRAAGAGLPIGAYANVGFADQRGQWVMTESVEPECYARMAAQWVGSGARIVGGCCGTTPEHIISLRQVIEKSGTS